MEIKENVLYIISTYKYAGLYALFVIDTMGVFLPSKTILTLAGILVQTGQLSFGPLFLSAFTGSLTGFSISYTIGLRVGKPFFLKYGKYLRITGRKIERAERWFSRFGPAVIIIAYFTPGVRHITPYLSGIAGMTFTKTITFAAIGAALWITTFVSLGRFFGQRLDLVSRVLDRYQWEALLLAALAAAAILAFKRFVTQKKS
ncbi:MAG: DedA family protein [Bacillota bacterium]